MKPIRLLFLALGLSLFFSFPTSIRAEDVPSSYSINRYTVIWQDSIFAKPKTKRPAQSKASQTWALAGTYKFSGGIGAMIVDRKSGSIEQLEMGRPNPAGIKLVEVKNDVHGKPEKIRISIEGKSVWVNKR